MNHISNIIRDQFAYSKDLKNKKNFFLKNINSLTLYHYKKSKIYRKYLDGLNYNAKLKKYELSDIPFLPVRLFKEFDFLSINKNNIYKILYSSGTSSNGLSKIYLDKDNALNQIKALQKIFNHLIGNSRLPMLVIDKKELNLDKKKFNASSAAINGFSIFANEIVYLCDQKNNIDYDLLNTFLEKHHDRSFLIFGFTSNIYLNLIKKLNTKNLKYKDFSKSILIHGGGWKKIEDKKIDRNTFNSLLRKKINIKNVKNYYGLVEQIGSIFFECNCGYFIPSNFSEIIIRDENFNVQENGKKGLVQLLSLLPTSYPGHSILTEDIGEIVNDDRCKCFGKGKRFKIYGRLKNAEIRGCANV